MQQVVFNLTHVLKMEETLIPGTQRLELEHSDTIVLCPTPSNHPDHPLVSVLIPLVPKLCDVSDHSRTGARLAKSYTSASSRCTPSCNLECKESRNLFVVNVSIDVDNLSVYALERRSGPPSTPSWESRMRTSIMAMRRVRGPWHLAVSSSCRLR